MEKLGRTIFSITRRCSPVSFRSVISSLVSRGLPNSARFAAIVASAAAEIHPDPAILLACVFRGLLPFSTVLTVGQSKTPTSTRGT